MAIVYVLVKGAPLTKAEFDGNLSDLDSRLTTIEGTPPTPKEIANFLVEGSQFTVVMDDATEYGPFTLPQQNFRPSIVKTVATTSYTPILGDVNYYMRCTDAAGCAVTLPDNATVAFPIDTELTFRQLGAATVTFDAPTGVTINGVTGYLNETAAVGATVTLKKIATDAWDIIGHLKEDVSA